MGRHPLLTPTTDTTNKTNTKQHTRMPLPAPPGLADDARSEISFDTTLEPFLQPFGLDLPHRNRPTK